MASSTFAVLVFAIATLGASAARPAAGEHAAAISLDEGSELVYKHTEFKLHQDLTRDAFHQEERESAESAIDPARAADTAGVRICMNNWAAKFERFVRNSLPELAPGAPEEAQLGETLIAYNAIHDQLEPHGWLGRVNPFAAEETKMLKVQEDSLMSHLRRWGYDPYWAEIFCTGMLKESKKAHAGASSCVDAVKADSASNSGMRKIDDDVDWSSLESRVQEGVELQHQETYHKVMALTEFKIPNWGRVNRHWKEIQSDKKLLEFRIKFAGGNYDLYQKLVQCEVVRNEDMDFGLDKFAERVDKEINGPAMVLEGACRENSTHGYCSEGMSPQFQRAVTPERGAKWGTVTFMSAGPLSLLTGALAGAVNGIPGGPVGMLAGATTGVAVAAGVPMGLILAPIASVAGSMDMFPSCRCFENKCALDPDSGKCAMQVNSASSNPFQWLPYPGQKCVQSGDACSLQLCGPAELAAPTALQGVFGVVGRRGTDILNCLSVDGTVEKTLGKSDRLPGSAENTPANRNELYEQLGVE